MLEKIKEKITNKNIIITALIIISAIALVTILAVCGLIEGSSVTINYSDEKRSAIIELGEDDKTNPDSEFKDMGEAGEKVKLEDVPTVEEIDGGKFEDADTGVSAIDGEYSDLGAAVETFDTSSPQAFRNAVLGRCVIANNRYGAQCVSLARSYWWSYAGRDVSTCGTGAAKGMMNCAAQNAGTEFLVFWKDSASQIQAGDWLIFDGGQYGHVGMALGPVTNGYVALLGENQGGKACLGGGSAANIINMNIKNLIGFYRPKTYVKPAPKPTPTPAPTPFVAAYTVKKGDSLGVIARKFCGYNGKKLFGNDGYTQKMAEVSGIKNRTYIYVGQKISCPSF